MAKWIWIALGLHVVAACAPSSRSQPSVDPSCTPGQQRCLSGDFQTCVEGFFATAESCPEACDPSLGCLACVPGTSVCADAVVKLCRDDGSGYDEQACDPLLGSSCDPAGVECVGACAPATLGLSYIGCEYYPTVTGNIVANIFDFAVVIANTSTDSAMVTIDGGALATPRQVTVAPGRVEVVTLPWQDALKMCSNAVVDNCATFPSKGALVAKGAYHLRSTRPVTVYQFNPLQYTRDGVRSFSNDASLLLPVNAWGRNYLAATWPRLDASQGTAQTWPSLMAVTAAQDGTTVTITTKAETLAYGGAPAFLKGIPRSLVLNAGDVLELAAFGSFGAMPLDDLTGSTVTSDRPVQLISGHYCAYVPNRDVGYCDHLEESIFPIETLGRSYLVTAPMVPSLPEGKEEVVRIIATQPNTSLVYDPPQAGAATTLAAAGDYVGIARQRDNYLVTADQKIMVVQFMEGSQAGGGTGDPSMALAVPVEQYRSTYLFHAPTNYETNFVNVTAATGMTVMLDGAPVTGFVPIGGTGYGLARVQLPNNVDGNHLITSPEPFGISVYGYGQDTSYWYPGGLNLDIIVN